MVEGKVLDGPVAGTPDFSLTLEAMMQLKAGGRELIKQLPAVRHMLSTRTQPFGTLSRGYLFNQDEAKSFYAVLNGIAGERLRLVVNEARRVFFDKYEDDEEDC